MRFAFPLLLSSLFACTTVFAAPLPANTSAAQTARTFVRNAPLPAWVQPLADAPETKRTDALVIRLAETQAYVGKKHAIFVNQVIQANDRSALADIGQFRVDYIPAYQRLLLHKVAIIRNGKISDRTASASIRLLENEAAASQGVYEGATTMRLLLDDVQLGDALWISYTKEGSNPVFGNKWSDYFSLERSSPVELRRITLLQERGRQLDWTQAGDFKLNRIEPVVDSVGNLKRTRFEARNLDAVLMETSIPANYFPSQFLHVTEYQDWNEVARWASTLFPAVPASAQLDALVRQFARAPNDAEKAAAALQWVQDDIRYFSVSIGENSHRPQPPALVLKRRYGDCKDKAYLLVTLLRRMGIKADPVLVNATGSRVPGRLPPSTLWFDHAVVQVTLDGKAWLVDPTRTGEKGAIASRPAVLPGGVGLLVAPDSRALQELPASSPEQPSFERIEKMVLETLDGPAQLDVRTVYRDRLASQARRVFPSLSASELAKDVLSGHEKQYTGLVLAGAPQLVDSADGTSYEVRSRFTLDSPVHKRENVPGITFRTRIMEASLQIPDKVVRNFPFALPYGKYYARYRIEVVWPALTRSGPNVPVATTVDTPYFSARDEVAFRGRTMAYSLEYRVKEDEVAAAALPDMQAQVGSLDEFDTVTLRRDESLVVLASAKNMQFRELDTARWGMIVTELAGDKQARDDTGSDAYCNIVTSGYPVSIIATNKLPRKSFVEQALAEGIAKESRCDAVAAFKTGAFVDAARRFKSAGTLPDGHVFVPRQAWAEFHAGDRKAALAHMERFIRARIAERKLNSVEIADALSLYQRAGTPFPAFLLEQVPGDLEQWPRPVIAMQLGRISPGQLIALAEALQGDERTAALNDTWFHVAQFHFSRGDKDAGLDALRWYPANGLLSSDLHAHAFAELWHLEESDADLQSGLDLWKAGKDADAVPFFRRAAERHIPYGQYWLGAAYYNGRGVAKDHVQARKWFELSAMAGVHHGMNDLGVMALKGEAGPRDERRAVEWIDRAARHGHHHASNTLAYSYFYGKHGLAQDHKKAFDHYWQAAQLGNNESQAALALIYRVGLGQPEDPDLAHYWASRSTAGGSSNGMVELGILTLTGAGTDKDPKKAVDLFKKAAERGNHGMAQQLVGDMYIEGNGVKRDVDEAHDWYLKAAKNGSGHARYMLALFSAGEFGGKVDHVKALAWYKSAAETGHLAAVNNLADMYERGAGAPQDLGKAVAGYRQAAQAGLAMAMYSLATLYERGLGLPRENLLAYTYYGLAIQRKVDEKRINIAREKQALLIAAATPEQKAQADALINKWQENDPLPGVPTIPAAVEGAGGQGGK